MTEPEHRTLKTLFVGQGQSSLLWYRIALPAMYIGADWVGVWGTPPDLEIVTSLVGFKTQRPKFEDYSIIVVQGARGKAWFNLIRGWRESGIVVLFEVDDYLHGVRKVKDHQDSEHFSKADMHWIELCMRACDGMITSTDYIARRYQKMTPLPPWVCENGLDLGRYRLTPPRRGEINGQESVTLMWAGAAGNETAVTSWIQVVADTMRRHDHVCFASVGYDFASGLRPEFGDRVLTVPFAAMETYPAAMMLGDIALAPAGDSAWWRGKSELRAMEAAALGLPTVAAPHYDRVVKESGTGYIVENPGQASLRIEQLVNNAPLRRGMGDMARNLARDEFDMRYRCDSWRTALVEAWTKTKRI